MFRDSGQARVTGYEMSFIQNLVWDDMKMKKIKTVPIFKSIEEEAEFWDTHSTEDFPGYWQEAPDVKFAKNLKSIYKSKILPIRLDDKTKKAVEKVARRKGVKISDAASILIQERLIQLKVV